MDNTFDEFKDIINDEDTYEVISMFDENNQEIKCFVIDSIKLDEIQYLLVVPCDLFEQEDAEAFIIKQIDENGENTIYVPVEDDKEYNKVVILLQENDNDYEMKF